MATLLQNDHCTVAISMRFQVVKSRCYKKLIWDYSHADFDGHREYSCSSNINWDEECDQFNDVEYTDDKWSQLNLEGAKLIDSRN